MYGPANISGTSSHRETSNMRAGGRGREGKRRNKRERRKEKWREIEGERQEKRKNGQSTYSKHTDVITSSVKALAFNLKATNSLISSQKNAVYTFTVI